ncbi:MAG: hypothetical protein JSW03_04725 [Candidatus Eiseniibacteriota bacterium]|nr:MAG: hypothetical protein JSW03_04725 [Candidatus Eisenbacteria bacterium]
MNRKATCDASSAPRGSSGFEMLGRGPVRAALTALVAVLLLAGAAANAAGDIDWSLSAEIRSRPSKLELSPVDRGSARELWAEVIAGSYGVTVSFVKGLHDRRYDFGDIALMLEFSSASGKKSSDVAVLMRKGLGWGAIAKELGVHPSALKRAKGNESLFRRYVLAERLAGYYGMPDEKPLMFLAEKGYDFDEIVLAVNLCVHSGAPLREVVKSREKSPKWRGVAEAFKVSPTKLSVVPEGIKEKKAKGEKKAKEKTEQKEKATSPDKAKGKKSNPEKKSAEKGCSRSCAESCSKKCW